MSVPAVPPADASWLDPARATVDALAILRLTDQDDDAARVAAAAEAACQLVADYLDLCGTWDSAVPVPEPIPMACAFVTVDLYRRKDSPFGVLNAWSPDDIGPMRIGTDWLNSNAKYLLAPYKCGWGLA